jgi:asparagine synthase (glutamine-hydrolysing)
MCGIAGTINKQVSAERIYQALGHRGPDAQSCYKDDLVELFHLRLTILDKEGGAQPMHYKNLTIVFNGEIYNHRDLRRRFDLRCVTNSDTETLLHLIDKIGYECLQYLDGMFAFAIYHRNDNQLYLVRDRAGKKPLYIFSENDSLSFASELNALNSINDLAINDISIQGYLRLGTLIGSSTPYQNVRELLGGELAILNSNTLSIKYEKWWSIGESYSRKNSDSYEEAKNNVNEYLQTAVKRRLDSSDLEVGTFLSGGIDSGLITGIAAEHKKNLKTFTVSFEGSSFDESQLAAMVAQKYCTDHSEIRISLDSLSDDVTDIIANYGEPFFDSSAIPSYYVSKEAKKHITVVLNGDGADELFGGYRRYVAFDKYDYFNTPAPIKRIGSYLVERLKIPGKNRSLYSNLYRLLFLMSGDKYGIYLRSTSDIFEGHRNCFLFNEELLLDSHIMEVLGNKSLTGLKRIMNMDFENLLFSDLLVKMDIATMANSLEGRSPFLCKELLEYAPSINDNYKIRGARTKVILRDLANDYLPYSIVNQPKRGFEIPLVSWVDNELKDIIRDYLVSGSYSSNFVSHNFITKLIDNELKCTPYKRAKMIWTLFCLDVWYELAYKRA